MAEEPHEYLQRQMSLVPYSNDSREVVLRHGNAVVVYDSQSRQLSLRAPPSAQHTIELTDCPYCHRPLHDASPHLDGDEHAASSGTEPGFVNPDYFRMLAHSTPGSVNSSRPSSPRKQLPQPALSTGSRSPSSSAPPTGAEFMGSAPAPQSAEHGISGSSFLPGYFKSFFVEKRELGRGGRGVVLLVEHRLDGVLLGDFACKRIPVGNDHDWLAKVLLEVQLLQRLNHQNLVSYRHVWLEDAQITNFGPSVPCVFILQQYCNAGDLHNHVLGDLKSTTTPQDMKERMRRKSRGQSDVANNLNGPRRMQFEEIFSFFRDITSGLHHLHTNGYIHRDLKPSNCLLHNDGQKLSVLVSDFGEVQTTTSVRNSTGATGTISYCAPEVLRLDASRGVFGNFSTKSDIFSLGMIVYFIEDLDQLRAEITAWAGFDDAARVRADLPEKLYRFLKRLLSLDPAERPSTEDILQGIRAGAGLEDYKTGPAAGLDDRRSRISAVDSPAPKPTGARNPDVRPGLSQLRRHTSGDADAERALSPVKRSRPLPRPDNPALESSVVLRTRKVNELPYLHKYPSRQACAEKHRCIHRSLREILYHPMPALSLKAALFVTKVVTLSYPCTPYAASPWFFYPLLCTAVLDLGLLDLGMMGSLMLFGAHLAVVFAAQRWDRLCAGKVLVWQSGL
ncbi:putative serine/threonine-protein kinase iks1 [Taxawa tesnikishii (nom. ined.)]|nr:putative serine/threonine-protein kinase iks1 [Dothideales sp. JES 119]